MASAGTATPASHPLKDTWVLWEHSVSQKNAYNKSFSLASEHPIKTVEGFWRFFNYYPKPSQLFFDGLQRKQLKRGDNQPTSIGQLSLFKEGVQPEWEDPAHKKGMYLEIRLKGKDSINHIDDIWETVVLTAIGNTMKDEDLLTGVRIIDKARMNALTYKCEAWFRDEVPRATRFNIEETVEKAFGRKLTGVQWRPMH